MKVNGEGEEAAICVRVKRIKLTNKLHDVDKIRGSYVQSIAFRVG